MSKEEMLKEYKKWFNTYYERAMDSKDAKGTQALLVDIWRNKLQGMVLFMWTMKVITEDDYLKMTLEVDATFNTEQLFGYVSYLKPEVIRC